MKRLHGHLLWAFIINVPWILRCVNVSDSLIKLSRQKEPINSAFNFLILRDSFYECSQPTVLDTQQMKITSIKQLNQYCVSDLDKCTYYQWNPDAGTAYICSTNDFVSAEPRLGWSIGVKPSILAQYDQFNTMPNMQAVCDKELQRQTVNSMKDAIKRCNELNCNVFTMNLNKGEALGPAISPLTTWYCTVDVLNEGMTSGVARNGFLTFNRADKTSSAKIPSLPTGIRVPCGLNGPVCSNDFVKGHQQGDIMSDHVTRVEV